MLVIPDIHHKIDIAESILKKHPDEPVIFLGDYFDDFLDTPEITKTTALWLKRHLNDPNKIFLFGNHDLSYAYSHINGLVCSGWTREKQRVITETLTQEDWAKLKFCHEAEGFLFTHAGKTAPLEHYRLDNSEIRDTLAEGSLHILVAAGRGRGGMAKWGGITWCDFYREFSPIRGVKQIFGHTPSEEPRERDGNWCLDTHLKHYAIVHDGKVEIGYV